MSAAAQGIAAAHAATAAKDDASRGTRVFCLQKVVEVASVNMHRSAVLWVTIWRHLASCLTVGACHADEQIAMFAVDALKQLSFKFVTSEMLRMAHTQRVVLQPFVTVRRHSGWWGASQRARRVRFSYAALTHAHTHTHTHTLSLTPINTY